MNTNASVKISYRKINCLTFEPLFCTKCNLDMPTGVVDIHITVRFDRNKFPITYLLCALCRSLYEEEEIEDEYYGQPPLLGVRFVKL